MKARKQVSALNHLIRRGLIYAQKKLFVFIGLVHIAWNGDRAMQIVAGQLRGMAEIYFSLFSLALDDVHLRFSLWFSILLVVKGLYCTSVLKRRHSLMLQPLNIT